MSLTVAPGDVIAGKYRVDRVLGQGGMGVVVAASHLHLPQRMAGSPARSWAAGAALGLMGLAAAGRRRRRGRVGPR